MSSKKAPLISLPKAIILYTPTAPKESEQPPEKDQQLTAKGRPPVPPKNLQQSYSKTGVKEEPPLSPKGGPPGVVEVVDVEASSKKIALYRISVLRLNIQELGYLLIIQRQIVPW